MRSFQSTAMLGIRLGLSLTLMGLLAGPGSPARPVEATPIGHTVTLQPVGGWRAGLHHTLDEAPLSRGNTCESGVEQSHSEGIDVVAVGYSRYVTDDVLESGLLRNCITNDVAQARVAFDVSELTRYPLVKGLPVKARLTYREQREVQGTPPRGSQGITCVKQAHVAATDGRLFQGMFAKGEEVFRTPVGHAGPPLNSDPWDLGDAVEGWMNGSIANHGVVLSGFDESGDQKEDSTCLSTLSDVQLEVLVYRDVAQSDLKVTQIDVKDKSGANGCVSGRIDVTASVQNVADIPTPYEINLRVDGIPVETVFASIGQYESKTVTFSTLDLSAGEHVLVVQADPNGEIDEIDENNNLLVARVTCASGAAPKPEAKAADLQVSKVEILDAKNAAGCVAGKANTVHAVIKNAGDVEVGAVITIQLSIDGKPAGTVTMGGVGAPPNNEKDAYFSNVDLAKGAHTIRVTVNPDGKVPEANETNNTSTPLTVTCTDN